MAVIHGIPTNYERAWDIIQERRRVTSRDLADAGIDKGYATTILSQLKREGFLAEVGTAGQEGSSYLKIYELKDECEERPSLRGMQPRPPDWRRQAWTTMRIKREFTADDLMITFAEDVEIGYASVRNYCGNLEKAGYIRRIGPTVPGRTLRYRIIRDNIPEPPPRKALLKSIKK